MESKALATIIPDNVQTLMRESDVALLDRVATEASVVGAQLHALAYLAAYRISEIYAKVERTDDKVLHRAFRMWAPEAKVPEGATALRWTYCEHFFGWTTFNAWLSDWTSGVPVSKSSAWSKVADIEGWREQGAAWPTIVGLLSNTPMAGREALTKPVAPEALPPGGMPQYLEELSALPPGQARKKVSEDAGEPQFYISEMAWIEGVLYFKIHLESGDGLIVYDLVCKQVSAHESWAGLAVWLADKLGFRLKIGG